ncbi:unnamed protein product [Pichia kudriavzevii]
MRLLRLTFLTYIKLVVLLFLALLGYLLYSTNFEWPKVLLTPTEQSELSIEYRPYHQFIDPKLSLEEKCRAYFTHLFKEQPDWTLTPKLGESFSHAEKTKSQDLVHLNLYNHCYMSNDFAIVPEWDEKMYPYLSRKLPVFQHWSGVQSYGKPEKGDAKIDELSVDSYKRQGVSMEPVDKGVPFWRYFKANLEGRGIIVSLSDNYVKEATKLIGNLKALSNTLPIQFFHRGDLSNDGKLKLTQALMKNNEQPLFDIWFVDVSPCLNEEYKGSFGSFFNKMLAYGFNTFQRSGLIRYRCCYFQAFGGFVQN